MSALDVLNVRTDFPPVASSATPRTQLYRVPHAGGSARLKPADVVAIRAWGNQHAELTVLERARAVRAQYPQVTVAALDQVLRNGSFYDESYTPAPFVERAMPESASSPAPAAVPEAQSPEPVASPRNNLHHRRVRDEQLRLIREHLAEHSPERKVAV